ncbi:MAG: hypothetical protein HRU77_01705 [Gammaproteobacteria bacterium]|nr:MAG: hypothetical protein HRU77_01705 [Gammaproteobacteria bacterium]
MDEIAEMMLDGSLCKECGAVIGDGNGEGFAVTCSNCLKGNGNPEAKQRSKKPKSKMKRYPCKICGKSFAVMSQHLHHAHGIKS